MRSEELAVREREVQSRRNAHSLKLWDEEGGAGWGLDEKLQALDAVLMGVWNMSEGGGRYNRVVRKFERWVGGVEEVLERRENDQENGAAAEDVAFVSHMETSWRDECDGLGRKLEGWRGQLRDLGEVGGGESSLNVVVKGVNAMVRGMQQELLTMRKIELEAVRREEEWIREAIDSGDGDSDSEDGETPGAIWRAY